MLRDQTVELAGISSTVIVGEVEARRPPTSYPMDEVTSIRLRLRDAGYTPVPAMGKACALQNWSSLAGKRMPELDIRRWGKRQHWNNTGIVCGDVLVIDLDIDKPDYAKKAKQIVVDVLGPDIPCRVGQEHRASYFLLADANSKYDQFNGEHGKFELLTGAKHCIVHGIHKDTGRPFRWVSEDSLWEVPKERLQRITEIQRNFIVEQLKALISVPEKATTEVSVRIPDGSRDLAMLVDLKDATVRFNDFDEYLAWAREYTDSRLALPFSDEDLGRYTRHWWKRKAEGRIFLKGGQANAVLRASERERIKDSNAIHLLLFFRMKHSAEKGRLFPSAAGSSKFQKELGMKEKVIRRATHILMTKGFIRRVSGKGRKGDPYQYKLLIP